MFKRQPCQLHVHGKDVSASRATSHAAESARIETHTQTGFGVVVKWAESAFPLAATGQFPAPRLEVLGGAGEEGTLESACLPERSTRIMALLCDLVHAAPLDYSAISVIAWRSSPTFQRVLLAPGLFGFCNLASLDHREMDVREV